MKDIFKIMICDDSITERRKFMDDLSNLEGCEILEAEDGQDAVEKFDELKPDLVFMDIIMPRMDGIEAVREIVKKHDDAKIIMLTSAGTTENLNKSLEAGAIDFIQKPWYALQIISIVNNMKRGW